MKKLNLVIEVHQPMRLRTYRFTEIGSNHHYYDDYENEYIIRKVSEECYIPINKLLLDSLSGSGNRIKLSFLFSGIVLDQFELYVPEVITSYKSLINTGQVELLPGSYSNSFGLLPGNKEFNKQITLQKNRIRYLFGNNPVIYNNEYIIPSDPLNPGIGLLVRNNKPGSGAEQLFTGQFHDLQPFSSEKFKTFLDSIPMKDDSIATLFIPYSISGDYRNIWLNDFLGSLQNEIFSEPDNSFADNLKRTEIFKPESQDPTPGSLSYENFESPCSSCNEMQKDAFDKLYSLSRKVDLCSDTAVNRDWLYLQSRDHFYFMDQEMYEEDKPGRELVPYDSSFLAYINYMNVLEDFSYRLSRLKTREIKVNKAAMKKWEKLLNKSLIPSLLK
jgi:alpha-amylase